VAEGSWHPDRGCIGRDAGGAARDVLSGGTSRAKVQQSEKKWLELPWQKVRESVEVKLFAQDGEL